MSAGTTRSERVKGTPSRRVAVASAFLAIAAIAVLGARWWTHPAIFGNLGDAYTSQPRPLADAALSTAVILPKVDGEPETVTIHGARAVLSTNTARATVTFSICHLGAGEDPIGAVHDPEAYCRDIEPLEPGSSFRHGVAPDTDYLFVTLAPTRAGVAHLERVEIRYERGIRRLYQQGVESIRADRRITVGQAEPLP